MTVFSPPESDAVEPIPVELWPRPTAVGSSGGIVLAVVAIGIAGDLATRSGFITVGGALGAVVTAAALLATGRLVRRDAKVLVGLAALFAVFLSFRSSPWLVVPNTIVSIALFVVAVVLARSGGWFDSPPRRLLRGVAYWVSTVIDAVGFALAPARGRRSVVALRGALIAAPVLVVIVALLASADEVFARLVGVDQLSADDVFVHLVLFTTSAWIGAMLLRTASTDLDDAGDPPPRVLGAVEGAIVLGAIGLVLGAFALAQVIDVVGVSDRLVGEHFDRAEYARSGFFQLLWVAGIIVTVVLAVRLFVRHDSLRSERWIDRLGLVTCLLTLPVVAVSVRRLSLYADEYGLTMLRLYSTVAAISIGIMLLLIAAAIAGVGRSRAWLPGALAIVPLVALLGLDVMNPEALVARVNMERENPRVTTDGRYLALLSDDAVPTIVANLDRLAEFQRDRLTVILCDGFVEPDGGLSTNFSEQRAHDALRSICTPSSSNGRG